MRPDGRRGEAVREETRGMDAETDVERRVRRVGTGASDRPGMLETEAGPGGDEAETDVRQRVRHLGTGGHGDVGDRAPESAGERARADVQRRIRGVGTGASQAAGTLGSDPAPDTGGARRDVERRVRHLGTGASGTAGDATRSER
ncbi:hypothetical protein GCM10010177_50480 [Actinomadura citrea]|nr:hypothetical protein GCM10010177_50480 [Actinomadura citrea]